MEENPSFTLPLTWYPLDYVNALHNMSHYYCMHVDATNFIKFYLKLAIDYTTNLYCQ